MAVKLKIIDWNKSSTKVLVVVFVALMILASYFIYSSYKIYLNNAEEATLERLKGISNTMTLSFDYKDMEHLNKRLVSNQYKDIEQDATYLKIHHYLKECQRINKLETEISVLYLDSPTHKFYYICTSNDTCFFGDTYIQTTQVFVDAYDKGAVISKYSDEYGTWLTSFSPILNNQNKSVGIIEVDILFDEFIKEAKVQLYRNLLITVIICIITAFFLLNYIKIIIVSEEASKMKLEESYQTINEINNDIVQSINYAKRIQSAILPSEKLMNEILSDYFILYKPKDIVAGDFYWIEAPLPPEGGIKDDQIW